MRAASRLPAPCLQGEPSDRPGVVGDAPCQVLVRRPTHRQGCPQQRQERAHNRKTVDETMPKIRGYRGRRASSSRLTGTAREQLGGEASSRQIERLVDELILLANMITADPPRLPLPDHVHRLVSSIVRRAACCVLHRLFSLPATHANVATHLILFFFGRNP